MSTLTDFLTIIADAIREKKGTEDKIKAEDFANEIINLPDSGDAEVLNEIMTAYQMFQNNKEITEIKNLSFKKVGNADNMFYGCSNLKNVTNLNLENATYVNNLFYGCSNLENINNLNLNNVYSLSSTFWGLGNLQYFKNIYLNNVTSLASWSNRSFNLKEIENIIAPNNTSLSGAFSSMSKLIFIKNCDFGKPNTLFAAFSECTNLQEIPAIDCSMCSDCRNIFKNSRNIENVGGFINMGKNFIQTQDEYENYTLDFSLCTKLTKESLLNILNGLYDLNITYANADRVYNQKIKLYSLSIAKLTNEELDIARNKGWIVSAS